MFGLFCMIIGYFVLVGIPFLSLLAFILLRFKAFEIFFKSHRRKIEWALFLLPLYALVIVILGHASLHAKEGYALPLYISMGVGYTILGAVLIAILALIINTIRKGFDFGGIR